MNIQPADVAPIELEAKIIIANSSMADNETKQAQAKSKVLLKAIDKNHKELDELNEKQKRAWSQYNQEIEKYAEGLDTISAKLKSINEKIKAGSRRLESIKRSQKIRQDAISAPRL